MREISLHLMDIIENSVGAKADFIEIEILENIKDDILKITITDNGYGMDNEMLNKVTDPFVTSRTTRRVGLGISLFKSACERCEGSLNITSQIKKGTKVIAIMKYSHIDRAPLGKIEDTLLTHLMNSDINLFYIHRIDDKEFNFDTHKIKEIVGDDLSSPNILLWIKEYIRENIENIGGGL
jgi:hypothetical protein